MKEGWKYVDFKDIYPIKMGKTPPRGDKSCWDIDKVTNNKWVSIADISQNEGKTIYDTKEYISDEAAKKIYCVEKGALLMSFKLSIGRMAFAGDNLYTNEAIIAIPHNDSYILRFVYYYFLSYDWKSLTDGNEKVKGATLNKQSIGKIKLPIISLSEQQRIVSRLDASFAKIDALSKQAEESVEHAKALFQAKLKELMETKEGWEEKKIEEVSENLDYRRKPITKGKRESGVYPYYGASGIVDYVKDYIYDEDILLVSEDGANLLARSTPIAFSVTGKVWVNNHAHVLKFDNFYTQRFVEYFFASIDISPYVTGAAQPKFNQARLNSLVVPMPPLSEQERIVQTLDSLSQKIQQLQQNYNQTLANCQALKQAILKETFE